MLAHRGEPASPAVRAMPLPARLIVRRSTARRRRMDVAAGGTGTGPGRT
ncbi:hypothetical protein [Actinomadura sp. CNU-125]|nr:hypothetical protein [Actinomadura sp. CNU-125]